MNDKEKHKQHNMSQKNFKLMISTKQKNSQINGYMYKAVQNTKLSVLPIGFEPSSDSYLHCSSPSSSISDHHLKLTRSLPVMFCTVQKSNDVNINTNRNVATSSPRIAFKNRKQNRLNPLKRRWKTQTTGLFAVDKNPPSCSYWCYISSEEIALTYPCNSGS